MTNTNYDITGILEFQLPATGFTEAVDFALNLHSRIPGKVTMVLMYDHPDAYFRHVIGKQASLVETLLALSKKWRTAQAARGSKPKTEDNPEKKDKTS